MDTVTLRSLKTDWKSTQPNPDESFLKNQLMADIDNIERSLLKTPEALLLKQTDFSAVLKANGMKNADVDVLVKRDADLSMKALREAQQRLLNPTIDFTEIHKKDLELAKKNAEQTSRAVIASTFLWKASYGGYWSAYNGETEEIPSCTISSGANRFDPSAQAYGEGWYDSDYSEIHGYLAFQFTPPSWGHLHVYVYPWLHGFFSLYSNDAWYKSEYARAEVDTWVDVHQNFWRPRQYSRRFTLGGYELNPTRSGRIDAQYGHGYTTNVGIGDTVTIRVGVRLFCRGKAGGAHSLLNFSSGNANFVYVPYVYCSLHN